MTTIDMKSGSDGSWEPRPIEPASLFPDGINEAELMADIQTLAEALDPKKVFDLSQKDWNILRGGGVSVDAIFQREKDFVLSVYVNTVLIGSTCFEYRPEDGHFYCYKRDDLPADFDQIFGKKILAMLKHAMDQGVQKQAAIAYLQHYFDTLISRTLATPEFSFFEGRILYPAAYGARNVNGGIHEALDPDITSRVRQLQGEISRLSRDALREAPQDVDKGEITAAVDAIHAWIEQFFLRPEYVMKSPANLPGPDGKPLLLEGEPIIPPSEA